MSDVLRIETRMQLPRRGVETPYTAKSTKRDWYQKSYIKLPVPYFLSAVCGVMNSAYQARTQLIELNVATD